MSAVVDSWTVVCDVDDIVPNCGVAALVEGRHVAVFRVADLDGVEQILAIDNVDPRSGASVLSRGLVGNLGDRLVVASPLYKQHFDLRTGECIEAMEQSVRAHAVEVVGGKIRIGLR